MAFMLPGILAHILLFLPLAAILFLSLRLRKWGFVFFCFTPMAWADQAITLAWDASTDPAVMGYVVYYGTASGNYTTRMDVGTNLTVTITNLQPGLTYYFAITDYNDAYFESAPSGEITYLVPGILLLTAATNSPNASKTLSFPVVPSHWYEVQSSTNLQDWRTLWQSGVATSNDWVQFTDEESGKISPRYYRLILH
jgi:Fibronectin type III domain